MYAAGGTLYVFLVYGMHHCVNIIMGSVGNPVGVLIRALEPEEGLEEMAQRRNANKRASTPEARGGGGLKVNPLGLCSGPGRLCQVGGHSERRFITNSCSAGLDAILMLSRQGERGHDDRGEGSVLTSEGGLAMISFGPHADKYGANRHEPRQALGIDRGHDGQSLLEPGDVHLEHGDHVPSEEVLTSERIGVAYAKAWSKVPLRFSIRGNPYVSKPFPWT
jgi:3-methyladenine DNA glycosylase Mpg